MRSDHPVGRVLAEYLDYLVIEKDRSPRTRDAYARELRSFFSFAKIRDVRDITHEAIRAFRIHLAERGGLKKSTQAGYAIAIRAFLRYLSRRDIAEIQPEKIELPAATKRQVSVIEYADLERLLDSPHGSGAQTVRDRAILETLFSTGLRVSELCALNRDLNLKRGELSIRGKGGRLRIVFLSERAKRRLAEYLALRGDGEEALFVSYSRSQPPVAVSRITPRSVQRLVEFSARAAGIPRRVSPHTLRHLFATDLLMNGADLRSVQELLGHASIQTTQVYTHLTNPALRDIHKAFHARRRGRE